jgi:hypothetical protein
MIFVSRADARRLALFVLSGIASAAAIAAPVTHNANPLPQGVQQGGFEQPNLAVPSFSYAPTGSAWTLQVGGGLATTGSAIKLDGSSVDPLGAADGDQVGFIQNTTDSRIFQNVNLTAGSYRLTVKSAQRPGNNQTLKAQVDGVDVLTMNPANSTAWQTYSADFSVAGGSHPLSFHGLDTNGHTAFIDQVQLQPLGLLADGGFEYPAQAPGAVVQPPVAGSLWSSANGVIVNGSVVTTVPAPQGQQAGFVQAGTTLFQTFNVVQAGRYRLQFKAAQRPGNQQSLKVTLDSTDVGLAEPDDENYSTFVFEDLKLASGSHTLAFTGQTPVTGDIALIDDVRLDSLAGRSRPWSAPSTWATNTVPASGDSVVIPDGAVVVLDSDVELGSLHIEEGGELHCADQNLGVDANDILVEGLLVCGSRHSPYEHQLTITLHGERPRTHNPNSMGVKVLGAMAPGVIELHGNDRKGWTQLAADAAIDADEITLAEAMDWQAGDRIVIAPTRADPGEGEVVTITAVSGNVVEFTPPLDHYHHGQYTDYSHGGSTWRLDERAEVGLLSRNIRIQGDEDSAADRFGGHMMTMAGSVIHASGIELYRMGQGGLLARYPFHWHVAGDVKGQYIHNSSVHESYNRCITVHRSNYAEVTDNVCYDFIGHGYFLEDGNEQYNRIDGNLGIWARKPHDGEQVLETDLRVGVASNGPAVFWMSNPTNTVTGNVAAGTEGSGFWYHTEDNVPGTSMNPKIEPFGVFDGNRMHTGVQGFSSCELEGGLFGMEAPGTLISNFSASNVDQALWPCAENLESMNATFEHVIVANTPSGMVSPSPVTMRDSVFVAYTGNANQHPVLGGEHIAAALWMYDQGVVLEDVRFINYTKPQSSVFANFGGAHKFVNNRVTGLSFDPPSTTNIGKDIMDVSEWPQSMVHWGDVIHDRDGSLLGEAGYALVSDHPLMWDHDCRRPDGLIVFGYACPYRYSQFRMTNDRVAPETRLSVQRSDGVIGVGPTPLSYRAVNEYIAASGYIHSYRFDTGIDRPYMHFGVFNGLSADVDVHEILDIPSDVEFWFDADDGGAYDWSEASGMKDLMEGGGRRWYYNADSSSLFLKTEATGTDWFASDGVTFCFTGVGLGCPDTLPARNLPVVTITSPATVASGTVTLQATATQGGGATISSLKFFVRSHGGTAYSGAAPLTITSMPAGSYAVKAVAVNSLGQSYTALQHLVVGEPVRRVEITSLAKDGTYTSGAVPDLQIALHGTDATPHHVRWWLNGVDKGAISGTSVTMSGLQPGRNDIEVALVNDADDSVRPERDRRAIYLVDNGVLAAFENGIDRRMHLYPAGPTEPSERPRFAWGFRYSSYGANDGNYDDTNLFVIPYASGLYTPAIYTLELAPLQDWSSYQSISVQHWGAAFDVYLVDSANTRTLIGSTAAGINRGAWNLTMARTAVKRLEFEQAQPGGDCSFAAHNAACWQFLYDITLSTALAL